MRASVLFEPRTPLKVEEVELEPPREGEVLVRMAASGVCHSCLHAADGSWQGVPMPIVLGDEGAGVVEPRAGRTDAGSGRPRRPLVGAHVRPLPLLRDRPGRRHGGRASDRRRRRQGGEARAGAGTRRHPRRRRLRGGPGGGDPSITGRGADFTFVAVGDAPAVGQAAEALAPGGTAW